MIASNLRAANKVASSSSYTNKESISENKTLFSITRTKRKEKMIWLLTLKERGSNALKIRNEKEIMRDHKIDIFPNIVDNNDVNVIN